MKLLSSTLGILLVLLFPIATSSQVPTQRPHRPIPPARPRIEEEIVRIPTTLIRVGAPTVLDNKDKIVTGLTADDFEIYENNKNQQITNFPLVELAPNKAAEPSK